MAAEVRPLILPTEADAELRMREMGLHGTSRSEALRLRRRTFKIHDLGTDERAALAAALQPLGGDLVFSNLGVDAVFVVADGQLRAVAALLNDYPFLAAEISRLADGVTGAVTWCDAAGKSLLRPRATTLMGILNVTPDSFSDGGRFNDPILAEERAVRMIEEGADIIDVGGLSTRPGALEIPVEEELARIMPVIGKLAQKIKVPISIDTYRSQVAEKAIDAGATIVNDVSGFTFDNRLVGVCARKKVAAILMHTPGRPDVMMKKTGYQDMIREIRGNLASSLRRALEAGIPAERIALDPGFGFGKTADQGWELLRRLGELMGTGRPLLVGISRKSMFKEMLGAEKTAEERDVASAAAATAAILSGANIVRVHNVKIHRDSASVADRLLEMPRL